MELYKLELNLFIIILLLKGTDNALEICTQVSRFLRSLKSLTFLSQIYDLYKNYRLQRALVITEN